MEKTPLYYVVKNYNGHSKIDDWFWHNFMIHESMDCIMDTNFNACKKHSIGLDENVTYFAQTTNYDEKEFVEFQGTTEEDMKKASKDRERYSGKFFKGPKHIFYDSANNRFRVVAYSIKKIHVITPWCGNVPYITNSQDTYTLLIQIIK